MRKELEHFYIGSSYGGNQDWFKSFMMRIGGCGAETACDSSLYFAIHRGIEKAYPFELSDLSHSDYIKFAHMMEKYLWPRMTGIDRLDIYIDGYGKYLSDRGVTELKMDAFSGGESFDVACKAVTKQIDAGFPIPTLTLNHRRRELRDYVWHWYLINGYDVKEDDVLVKAVTYSSYEWLSLHDLWNTGYARTGGFVLYSMKDR